MSGRIRWNKGEDRYWETDDDPIHLFFELTYANYLVLPRSVLQSMPVEWQRRFVRCLEEMAEVAPEEAFGRYRVNRLNDETGRCVRDPYSNYERGRRVVPLKLPLPTPKTDD